jgi:hypothetical protein
LKYQCHTETTHHQAEQHHFHARIPHHSSQLILELPKIDL